MITFASIERTDISVMSKIQGKAKVFERYNLIKLPIPSLKPMEWKGQVCLDSTGMAPSMMPNA